MKANQKYPALAAFLLAAWTAAGNAEPMKELAVYKGSLGKWACDARQTGSGTKFKAFIEYSVEFDGHTYIERYTEAANDVYRNPWKGIFLMSYDAETRRWVRNGVDNSGARNAATSSGWNGDTWVWENDAVNVVVSKNGANGLNFAIDVKDPPGVKRVVEATCRRA
jgi:hypothetical protein